MVLEDQLHLMGQLDLYHQEHLTVLKSPVNQETHLTLEIRYLQKFQKDLKLLYHQAAHESLVDQDFPVTQHRLKGQEDPKVQKNQKALVVLGLL